MEHAFGNGAPYALGIEEELLLVDPVTHQLAPVAEQVIPKMHLPAEIAAHEAYAAEVELRSRAVPDAGEAVNALRETRRAARDAGAVLMGAGVHPAGRLGDAPLVHHERYLRVDDEMRGLIRRTPECALHVHIGMPDPETAIRAFNGLRPYLPLLQGLSANSPWWFGVDSGMASARSALVRAYPGRGIPRAFRDFEDYASTVAAATRAGALEDYTFLWWDLRPHPRLGTIEVREMDAQSSLEDVAAIGALVHGLAIESAENGTMRDEPAEGLAWSSFRAARDGIDASLHMNGSILPLREAARRAVELARLHAGDAVDGIERILAEGGGAGRQRRAFDRGGMDELLAELVRLTAGP
jgi:carboxylate-amine ligase